MHSLEHVVEILKYVTFCSMLVSTMRYTHVSAISFLRYNNADVQRIYSGATVHLINLSEKKVKP